MKQYYQNQFRKDLDTLNFSVYNYYGIEHRFFGGEKWKNFQEDLQNIAPENKEKFIFSLFITVSVDQAFYSYLPEEIYRKEIEPLLKYPKFGWPGMGPHNEPPKYLIIRPVEFGIVSAQEILKHQQAAMGLFVDEVVDFQQNHYTPLNVREFFQQFINDRHIISYKESIVYEEIYKSLYAEVTRL